MTRTIHLMGRMGQLFGETHRLNCETVQEALHALDCMKGGVRRYLLDCTDTDVQFTVQKLILGIILVVVGFMMGAGAEGAKLAVAAGLFSTGMQLALQGIIELTMDDPDELKEEKSSLFNGPVNTTKMGVPVPICYGKMEVGGAVTNFGFTQSRVKNQMGYRFISKPSEGSTGTSSSTGGSSSSSGSIDWVNNQVLA